MRKSLPLVEAAQLTNCIPVEEGSRVRVGLAFHPVQKAKPPSVSSLLTTGAVSSFVATPHLVDRVVDSAVIVSAHDALTGRETADPMSSDESASILML